MNERWETGPIKLGMLGVFGLALGYAVVRYHVLGSIPWTDLPLYTLNKALALSAVVLIAASYWAARLRRRQGEIATAIAKRLGLTGFGLAVLHSLCSLALLSPHYYEPFYYPTGGLTLNGSLVVLTGLLSVIVFAFPAMVSLPAVGNAISQDRWMAYQRFGYWGLAITGLHGLVLGWESWFAPGDWPGGLLPISLLGTLAALLGLAARFIRLGAQDWIRAR